MQDKVTIIIRTIDNRYNSLLRAIKSIEVNDYNNIEVVLIYQGMNETYFEKLKNLPTRFPRLSFTFVNNPTNEDKRSQNANLGINYASGRYIGFLDDDDEFYSDHIFTLVDCIKSSDKVWAYSQTARGIVKENNIEYVDDGLKYEKFCIKRFKKFNFISMISFLIDTSKIKGRLPKFNEHLIYGEEYIFLLNLAKQYAPYCCDKVLSIASCYKNSPEVVNKSDKFTIEEKKQEYFKNYQLRKEKAITIGEFILWFYLKELIWHIKRNVQFLRRKPISYLFNVLKGNFFYP